MTVEPPFYATWQFWVLISALIPWTLFVLQYSRVYWYRTPIGRSLMLSKIVIVAVLVNSIAGWVLAPPEDRNVYDSPLRWGIFASLLIGSCVAGWYQLINLRREQRRAREEPECPRRRATDHVHADRPPSMHD